MATAARQSAASRLARRARDLRVPEQMEFLVFQDNGAAYRWRIVAGDGATLAQSGSFASHDRVEEAAERIRDGATLARPDRRAGEVPPLDRAAGRPGPRDELDAERWLDDGGSFSSEAVAK